MREVINVISDEFFYVQHEHDPFSQVSYRDNDEGVNIISVLDGPGWLILFPTELKAPDMGISVRNARL